MISKIRGTIEDIDSQSMTVLTNGVGFDVLVPQPVLQQCHEGDDVILYTHLVVYDDRFSLFGFLQKSELRFFLQLIKVRDVGPKSALAILSMGKCPEIQNAIINADTELLMSIPGIGKKTAERIILELKEKIYEDVDVNATAPAKKSSAIIGALTNLGYSAKEAKEAVKDMPSDLESDDDRLRWVLKKIGGQ